MSTEERVLVFPTSLLQEAGMFQGFTPRADYYLPKLLDSGNVSFQPRNAVETDPSFKQVIPYVVLKHDDHVFSYRRGSAGSEKRLQALRSIGIGGHINDDDGSTNGDVFRQGMLREVAEEVIVESDFEESCLGLINDDSSPVGQVHLGVVYLFELRRPAVRSREDGLTVAGFCEIMELQKRRGDFGTWSQFSLDALGPVK